jgi:hypothetical protein
MAKTVQFQGDEVIVSEVTGPTVNGVPQMNIWRMRADQAEKHLATFATHTEKVSAGDESAIRDAANAFTKRPGSGSK